MLKTSWEKMARALFVLLILATFQVSSQKAMAQTPSLNLNPNPSPSPGTTVPPKPPTNAAREYLEAHNQARAAVGVGPLSWSELLLNSSGKLVRYQRDKMDCQFANLTNSKYGANQLWAGGGLPVTPSMVVDDWVQEKKYYSHTNNSCEPNHSCGVYTQVVWRKSLELGCAQAVCVKDQASLTICFYNPPGNVVGESPY